MHSILISVVVGCAGSHPVDPSSAPVENAAAAEEAMMPVDLAASLGKSVSLVGVAENAKLGAVVVPASGGPVYVTGLDSWPDHLSKTRVRVSGTLQERKLAPDPVVGPNGERSAGMEGMAYVIDDAKWEVLP
jgi:hypothetical protein